MDIRVDPASPVPVYEQIRAQLATLIATGVLARGRHLPSIRRLSEELGIAPGTVDRAYQALEDDGLVVAEHRRGFFVADIRATTTPTRLIDDEARRFVLHAHQMGLSKAETLAVAERAWDGVVEGD